MFYIDNIVGYMYILGHIGNHMPYVICFENTILMTPTKYS